MIHVIFSLIEMGRTSIINLCYVVEFGHLKLLMMWKRMKMVSLIEMNPLKSLPPQQDQDPANETCAKLAYVNLDSLQSKISNHIMKEVLSEKKWC